MDESPSGCPGPLRARRLPRPRDCRHRDRGNGDCPNRPQRSSPRLPGHDRAQAGAVERLRPGMSVKVDVQGVAQPAVLLAPRCALVAAGWPARAELGDGRRVEVVLGPCSGQECVVLRGLSEAPTCGLGRGERGHEREPRAPRTLDAMGGPGDGRDGGGDLGLGHGQRR